MAFSLASEICGTCRQRNARAQRIAKNGISFKNVVLRVIYFIFLRKEVLLYFYSTICFLYLKCVLKNKSIEKGFIYLSKFLMEYS